MRRFAENTSVPVERSRAEIERTLTRYGATRFGSMSEPEKATIYFEVHGRQVQIPIPMPTPKDKSLPKDKWGYALAGTQLDKALDGERRRRWRVLLLTLKATLEAVESGLLTFDQAFLAHLVIPGTAKTIGETIVPKLDALYAGRSLPALFSGDDE